MLHFLKGCPPLGQLANASVVRKEAQAEAEAGAESGVSEVQVKILHHTSDHSAQQAQQPGPLSGN